MPAPAFRQRADFANPASTTNTYTVTMSSAVLAGSLLVMYIRASSAMDTVTDNVNGAWAVIGNRLNNGTNSNGWWFKANSGAASAGTLVVTCKSSNTVNFGIQGPVIEYTGVQPVSNPIRTFGQQALQAGGNSGSFTTPNAASSCNDGDFIIVGFFNQTSNSPTYGAGSLSGTTGTFGALTIRQAVANGNAGMEDGLATSAGTVIIGTASDGAVTWDGGITVFVSAGWQITGSLGAAGAGATVSYTGAASGSVTADGSGNYTISNLISGSYTITPTKLGVTFTPASRSVTIGHADLSGINFTSSSATNSTWNCVNINQALRGLRK